MILTGLIVAVALVRPDKKLASVTREDIEAGAKELGVDLWDHVEIVLRAMQNIAQDLGL